MLRHHGEWLFHSGARRRYARGFRRGADFRARIGIVRSADHFYDGVSRHAVVSPVKIRGAHHSGSRLGIVHAVRHQFYSEIDERGTTAKRFPAPGQNLVFRGRNATAPPRVQATTEDFTEFWPARSSFASGV